MRVSTHHSKNRASLELYVAPSFQRHSAAVKVVNTPPSLSLSLLCNLSFVLAEALVKDKEAGTFVVRDSTSYRGSFGLAMKVDQTSTTHTGKLLLFCAIVKSHINV